MAAPPELRPGLQLTDKVRFPPGLPITAHVIELANAIDAHPVVIVAGETGMKVDPEIEFTAGLLLSFF